MPPIKVNKEDIGVMIIPFVELSYVLCPIVKYKPHQHNDQGI